MRSIAAAVACCLAACQLVAEFPERGESDPVSCGNEFDDDADGLTDCLDPGCTEFCTETGIESCSNGSDDDADGRIDGEELRCVVDVDARVGFELDGRRFRCAAIEGTKISLRDFDAWRVDGEERISWVEGPSGTVEAIVTPGPDCSGLSILRSGSCPAIGPLVPVSGGPCWSMQFDLSLEAGTELAMVLTQAPRAPELLEASAVILELKANEDARTGIRLVDRLTQSSTVAADLGSSLSLRVQARADSEGDCGVPGSGGFTIGVLDGEGTEVEFGGEPVEWDPQSPIDFRFVSAGPGGWTLQSAVIEREQYSPCPFQVPQIPSPTDGPLRVKAVARGEGRICILASAEEEPYLRLPYDPRLDQGSPPMGPTKRKFSWSLHGEDLGSDSFSRGQTVGPFSIFGEERRTVISAAMTYGAEGFEVWALVELLETGTRRLLRLVSSDCETWTILPVSGSPEDGVANLHPLALERSEDGSILYLAEPAGAYRGQDSPQCEGDIGGFQSFGQDVLPMVKPRRSECMAYPRGRLWKWDGDEPARLRAALPSFDDWTVDCGCISGRIDWRSRQGPVRVTHVLSQDGDLAYLAAGRNGLHLFVDEEPDDTEAVWNRLGDAKLAAEPLLTTNPILGTFDGALVESPAWLPLSQESEPIRGLLFYTGFRAEQEMPDGGSLFFGGDVGVLPVHF